MRAGRSVVWNRAFLLVSLSVYVGTGVAGCGARAGDVRSVDESGEESQIAALREERSLFRGDGTRRAGEELDGTAWSWTEAHCLEGTNDLAARGFAQSATVQAENGTLLLIFDQGFEKEGCAETVFMRGTPVPGSSEYVLREETRVRAPSEAACVLPSDGERRGEVRLRGASLEVIVQRSSAWCGGFDLRMVYAPRDAAPLDEATLARHFAAHLARRDSSALARMYAEKGSLVDPQTLGDTGAPVRVDGRAAIFAWYERAFQGAEWVAAKLTAVHLGRQSGHVMLSWLYMDPRLETPIEASTRLLVADGEIFESETAVKATPKPALKLER
jgi:hypothetical protein